MWQGCNKNKRSITHKEVTVVFVESQVTPCHWVEHGSPVVHDSLLPLQACESVLSTLTAHAQIHTLTLQPFDLLFDHNDRSNFGVVVEQLVCL